MLFSVSKLIHKKKKPTILRQQSKLAYFCSMKSTLNIGILGAGQLGRMLSQAASRFGHQLHFLDQESSFPAAQISTHFTQGSFNDYEDVLNFGKGLDVISIEIENVNTAALKELEKLGKKVYPQSNVIDLIKDKGTQKAFYDSNDIPTSSFILCDGKSDIERNIEQKKIKLPFVQKARTGGYDGKGVQIINNDNQLERLMDVPSVIEQKIAIEKELSVVIARNHHGEVAIYDVVEMVFDPEANLVDYLFAPAQISIDIAEKCKQIALKITDKLDIIGILAVEMFLTKEGEVIVNEMAPRTHNSGHHTIDSSICSQFEQHYRILNHLPLGSTQMRSLGAMVNLVGEPNYRGKPYYQGIDKICKISGVFPHIYGKDITKPNRKMGHVNIVAKDLNEAQEKISLVKNNIKVISHE